jgi:hypothetical protein
MATITLDIGTLFQQVFGIGRGKPFDPGQAYTQEYKQEEAFDAIQQGSEEGIEFLSVREELAAQNFNGRSLFLPIRIGGVLLPNEPSVAISGRKRIVETTVVGSTKKGSVKELIGTEDYQLTIRGIAITPKDFYAYPEDQVRELKKLYERNTSLEITSALTSLLGIYRVVITSIEFPEMIGIQHAQAYQITCISDEDFILEID